jgi:hypothetical protein
VVFSVASTRELVAKADASDNTTNRRDESVVVPYRVATSSLANASVPFDVVIWPDGVTAPDRATAAELSRYASVVLPDLFSLTDRQAAAVAEYAMNGGTVVVTDRQAEPLARVPGLRTAAHDAVEDLLPHGPQVRTPVSVASNLHALPDGSFALHLVRYDYDWREDAVRAAVDVPVSVRLPSPREHATLISSDGTRMTLELSRSDCEHAVVVPRLGVYTILVLHDGELP